MGWVRLSRLICGCKTISVAYCYVGAEIPPAGAPAGFDCAAMLGFIA